MLTTFPQSNFSLEFLGQDNICYHGLSVSWISKIMHSRIVIKMPHSKTIVLESFEMTHNIELTRRLRNPILCLCMSIDWPKGLQFLQHNLYLMQYFSLEKVRLASLYDVKVRLYVIHFDFKAKSYLHVVVPCIVISCLLMIFLINREDNSNLIKTRNCVTKVDGISLGWLVMGLLFRFNVFKPLQSNHIKA